MINFVQSNQDGDVGSCDGSRVDIAIESYLERNSSLGRVMINWNSRVKSLGRYTSKWVLHALGSLITDLKSSNSSVYDSNRIRSSASEIIIIWMDHDDQRDYNNSPQVDSEEFFMTEFST